MNKPTEEFGTEAYKLVHKEDPDTSHEAAHLVDSATLERSVYKAVRSFGAKGCISDEVRKCFPTKGYSSITARYKQLLNKKYIYDTGKRRKGDSGSKQRVMVSYEFYQKK